MSGIALLGGALLLGLILMLPCIVLVKLAGTSAAAGAAVLSLHQSGGRLVPSTASERAASRALEAQRRAARA